MSELERLSLDNFILKRSRRKTIAIHVLTDGIEVRAPYYASLNDIRDFLQEKALWILNHQQWLIERESQIYKIKSGEKITFFGKPVDIDINQAPKNHVSHQNDTLFIGVKKTNQELIHNTLEKWLKKQAEKYLKERTKELAVEYQLLEKITDIKLRKTKTKWGHCTAQGVIQLNWLLIMAPSEVIDYVITHELCHLVHLNHSKTYWALVESFIPDYKHRQLWIKEHGHKLYFC